MSKAILILNEMPEKCANCDICHNEPDYGIAYCPLLRESTDYADERPDRCPLREIPEQDYSKYAEPASCLYQSGWNDAIRAIEGSGKDG